MAEIEDRIRSLENKIWIATGAAIVFAAWFGVASIWYIPSAVQSAVYKSSTGEAAAKIQSILVQAQKDDEHIAKLVASGSEIHIGGQCFKPRHLTRCFSGSQRDHMKFVDIKDECKSAELGYVEEQDILVLASCDWKWSLPSK